MASPYYLPQSLQGFESWSSNFASTISASPTTYGLTAPQATAYQLLHNAFSGALSISNAPATRTPVTVQDTQIAYAAVRLEAQSLVQIAQASGLIDSVAAAALGITFRDTTKTPIAAPTAIPELAVQEITPQAAKLRIKELGSLSNAIPFGSVGFEVAMSIAPVTPPMSPTELAIVGQGTKRFYDLSFSGADIGKAFYVAVRYVTAKQLKGPWSNIITSTVVGG